MAANATRLYLVRHGATAAHRRGPLLGRRRRRPLGGGAPPGPAGSAERLRRRADRAPSTAARCRAPSRPPRSSRGPHRPRRSMRRDGLREISHGRWEGLTRARGRGALRRASTPPGRPTRSRSRPRGASRASRCWRARCPVIREIVVAHAGRERARGLAQGDAAAGPLEPARASTPAATATGWISRPACLNVVDFKDPVRARLMLLQRHLALLDSPAERPSGTCRSGGIPRRGYFTKR